MHIPAKVMIVEDEVIVAMDLEQHLRDLGYTVTGIVTAGEVAVSKALEDSPDLILMDVQLQNEINVVKVIKEIKARMSVSIVYLTAYADDATLYRARDIKPHGYLVKPFNAETLQATVEMALHKFQSEQKLIKDVHVNKQENKVLAFSMNLVNSVESIKSCEEFLRLAIIQLTEIFHFPYAFAFALEKPFMDTILYERLNESITSSRLNRDTYHLCQSFIFHRNPWTIMNPSLDPCLSILKQYKEKNFRFQLDVLPFVGADDIIGLIGLGDTHKKISANELHVVWNIVKELVTTLKNNSNANENQLLTETFYQSNIPTIVTNSQGQIQYENTTYEDISRMTQDVAVYKLHKVYPFNPCCSHVRKELKHAIEKGEDRYIEIPPQAQKEVCRSTLEVVWPVHNTNNTTSDFKTIPEIEFFICLLLPHAMATGNIDAYP